MINRWYQVLNILFVTCKERSKMKFLRLAPTVFSSQITCDIASRETIQKSGCFIHHLRRTSRQVLDKRVTGERYNQHKREVHLDDRRPSQISEKQIRRVQ